MSKNVLQLVTESHDDFLFYFCWLFARKDICTCDLNLKRVSYKKMICYSTKLNYSQGVMTFRANPSSKK